MTMGYSVYQNSDGRWAGYGVPATCDQPDCGIEIDRGLSFRCEGCELFFCSEHLLLPGHTRQFCECCFEKKASFEPTPDTEEWTNHMSTDPSWQQWRDDQAKKNPTERRIS